MKNTDSRRKRNPIKGPGKFEGETYIAKYIYENNFTDDELGSVDELGWYGKFSGKLKGRGPFHVIVSESSQGFVSGEFFDTKKQLDKVWREIQKEYEKFDEGNEE